MEELSGNLSFDRLWNGGLSEAIRDQAVQVALEGHQIEVENAVSNLDLGCNDDAEGSEEDEDDFDFSVPRIYLQAINAIAMKEHNGPMVGQFFVNYSRFLTARVIKKIEKYFNAQNNWIAGYKRREIEFKEGTYNKEEIEGSHGIVHLLSLVHTSETGTKTQLQLVFHIFFNGDLQMDPGHPSNLKIKRVLGACDALEKYPILADLPTVIITPHASNNCPFMVIEPHDRWKANKWYSRKGWTLQADKAHFQNSADKAHFQNSPADLLQLLERHIADQRKFTTIRLPICNDRSLPNDFWSYAALKGGNEYRESGDTPLSCFLVNEDPSELECCRWSIPQSAVELLASDGIKTVNDLAKASLDDMIAIKQVFAYGHRNRILQHGEMDYSTVVPVNFEKYQKFDICRLCRKQTPIALLTKSRRLNTLVMDKTPRELKHLNCFCLGCVYEDLQNCQAAG